MKYVTVPRLLLKLFVTRYLIVHRIGARAERRVESACINDLKRVAGKARILYRIADAALRATKLRRTYLLCGFEALSLTEGLHAWAIRQRSQNWT